MDIQLRLKELRLEHQKKQIEVAKVLHVVQTTYSSYELGQRQLPLEALVTLSQYYQVSTDYILSLTDIE